LAYHLNKTELAGDRLNEKIQIGKNAASQFNVGKDFCRGGIKRKGILVLELVEPCIQEILVIM